MNDTCLTLGLKVINSSFILCAVKWTKLSLSIIFIQTPAFHLSMIIVKKNLPIILLSSIESLVLRALFAMALSFICKSIRNCSGRSPSIPSYHTPLPLVIFTLPLVPSGFFQFYRYFGILKGQQ